METNAKAKQPAQVPGDAESPPKGKPDHSIEQAVKESDRTEPVQSGHDQGDRKPA